MSKVRRQRTRENAGDNGELIAPVPPVEPMARFGDRWKCGSCGTVNPTDPNDSYPQCLYCGRLADEVAI